MAIDAITALERQPRGVVQVNGAAIDGWLKFDVNNNGYYSADTFQVSFSPTDLPADRDVNWFSNQTDMYVELFAGIPTDPNSVTASELKSWIYGQVDEVHYNPVTRQLDVIGRDLTRVFIDAKTTQKWVNKTSSQIATDLAISHGLTPVVTKTTTKAGKYYEIDHSNMADSRSEWDILCYLASNEGFRVYVRGKSLFFGPPPNPSTDAYQLVWIEGVNGGVPCANFENLECSRALTVSRGIQVIIRSWNTTHQKGFTASFPTKAKSIQAGKATTFGGVQIYSRVIPNLTQEQANQKAQQLYAEIIQHEMKIEFDMTEDDDLDTTSVVQLSGTATAWDQYYFPDAISRSMEFEGGWTMHASAKNHSPESQTGVL
jgi:hypothetical protein